MGESQALDQDAPVTLVAGQSLVLHVHTDVASASGITAEPQTKKEPAKEKHVEIRLPRIDLHHRTQKEAHKDHHTSLVHRRSGITPDKPKFFRHNQDIEGLVEMLNRVQNSRADDQRGLLRKEDLVLPEFLKLPTDEKCHHCQTTCQDAATGMETFPSCPDISSEDCSEKNISAGSTLPSQEAVCCLPSHIENSNASSYISIDSQDTAVTVADNNMTSLQMGEMCTEEKDDLL